MSLPLIQSLHQDNQTVTYASTTLLETSSLATKQYHFEYLDHTADLQLHSWAPAEPADSGLSCSFEALVVAMYAYMTNRSKIDCTQRRRLHASGHNLKDLLFHFLDEALFCFSGDSFLIQHVSIDRLVVTEDNSPCTIEATVYGEFWDSTRHQYGTEIKAITMSNMQIVSNQSRWDCYVIVDI